MFSRPVSSGWKPVPDLEQRSDAPVDLARGRAVGSVMRDRIFSSVLLPAPLRPMMPTTSPRAISNDTSSSAQNSVASGGLRGRATHAHGRRDSAVDGVAQRDGSSRLPRADAVALGQMLDANDDIGHAGVR